MSFSQQNLPVVIIACKVFEGLIERHLPENLAGKVTFLDYGLHRVPKNLNQTLQSMLDEITQPSLVVLAYGLCGNGLKGLKSGKHTLLIPRADDCIALLLGSYQAYRREFDAEPGTYWLSKGWLESGSNPLQEYQELEEKYGPMQAMWLMDQQYRNYRRLVLVVHNQEDLLVCRPKALQVAQFCQRWGMRYEEIVGSDSFVQRLAKSIQGVEPGDEDFILAPPGSVLELRQFLHM